MTVPLDSFLLDLFQELRTSGMALTLEQYELLRQAIARGYGLGGWEDIKRVCRLLWVKPNPNYDASVFERVFDNYIQQHHAKMPTPPTPKVTKTSSTDPVKPPTNLPKIPPRRRQSPSTQTTGEVQVPVAMQNPSTSTSFEDARKNFHFIPTDFPIKLQDVQVTWRLLQKPMRISWDYELDIEATLYQIEREGLFTDVVMRPVITRRTELLLLVDDSPAMVPFFPAFRPFIQAITESRITPAQIYRFTNYPGEYVYHWYRPSQAEPLSNLLPKLHRNRTVALIFSDGGAATNTYSQERIEGISQFLTALSPCIRQLIWLNPLPPQRWEQTSAWTIDGILNGKMLTYESTSLQTVTRGNTQEILIQTWQAHLHQQEIPREKI